MSKSEKEVMLVSLFVGVILLTVLHFFWSAGLSHIETAIISLLIFLPSMCVFASFNYMKGLFLGDKMAFKDGHQDGYEDFFYDLVDILKTRYNDVYEQLSSQDDSEYDNIEDFDTFIEKYGAMMSRRGYIEAHNELLESIIKLHDNNATNPKETA